MVNRQIASSQETSDNDFSNLNDENNNNNINNNNNSQLIKTNTSANLNSLASVAQVLLKNDKASSYSLSNLSAAASAEFMLNYGLSLQNKQQQQQQQHDKNLNESNIDDTTSNDEEQQQQQQKIKKPSSKLIQHNYDQQQRTKETTAKLKLNSNATFANYEDDKLNAARDINFKFNVQQQDMMTSSSNSRDSLPPVSFTNGQIQCCPDCSKAFTNKSALAKHRLIHSNERKYTCHLCDKSFKRQDHLNGHLLTHQDKKPFECKAPGCDKSYCDSRSLKRHVESQHQDYLASLATGNKEALNYLPSIGKIKATLAPNLQHEISVNDLVEASTNALSENLKFLSQNTASDMKANNESLDANNNNVNIANMNDDASQMANGQKLKNFFTYVEILFQTIFNSEPLSVKIFYEIKVISYIENVFVPLYFF